MERIQEYISQLQGILKRLSLAEKFANPSIS